jgi:hypothetical protein
MMDALNQPWHPIFIRWGGLTLVGLIKYIFKSLNRTKTGLTGVS